MEQPDWAFEAAADRYLAFRVGTAIMRRLAAARAKGRHGWWREEFGIDDLYAGLKRSTDEGSVIDMLVYAAMIYAKRTSDGLSSAGRGSDLAAGVERYTDSHLDRWGDIFVDLDLGRLLGVRFEQFIQAPHHYLQGQRARQPKRRQIDE